MKTCLNKNFQRKTGVHKNYTDGPEIYSQGYTNIKVNLYNPIEYFKSYTKVQKTCLYMTL